MHANDHLTGVNCWKKQPLACTALTAAIDMAKPITLRQRCHKLTVRSTVQPVLFRQRALKSRVVQSTLLWQGKA
ncbi:Pathogenicity locus [Acetobacter orientalis]|uniref:Pathogenicity locus n=1 Tax=Acetobacter orientalis TaxID=146474 RepID=A0A2Z5ZG31_9PROT|nr:Pathogenicity locus [Acetobacter orientalis]